MIWLQKCKLHLTDAIDSHYSLSYRHDRGWLMGFAFIMDSNGNSLDIHCCNKYSPSHSAKVSQNL